MEDVVVLWGLTQYIDYKCYKVSHVCKTWQKTTKEGYFFYQVIDVEVRHPVGFQKKGVPRLPIGEG